MKLFDAYISELNKLHDLTYRSHYPMSDEATKKWEEENKNTTFRLKELQARIRKALEHIEA